MSGEDGESDSGGSFDGWGRSEPTVTADPYGGVQIETPSTSSYVQNLDFCGNPRSAEDIATEVGWKLEEARIRERDWAQADAYSKSFGSDESDDSGLGGFGIGAAIGLLMGGGSSEKTSSSSYVGGGGSYTPRSGTARSGYSAPDTGPSGASRMVCGMLAGLAALWAVNAAFFQDKPQSEPVLSPPPIPSRVEKPPETQPAQAETKKENGKKSKRAASTKSKDPWAGLGSEEPLKTGEELLKEMYKTSERPGWKLERSGLVLIALVKPIVA